MKRLTCLPLILVTNIAFASDVKPSFECTKASGEVENLICHDQALATLDLQMDDLYKQVLPVISEQALATFKASQRGWIKGRNDCWKSDDVYQCVKNSYALQTETLAEKGGLLVNDTPTYYQCTGGVHPALSVRFYQVDNQAKAILHYGLDNELLDATVSASGAKYINDSASFWSHKQTASVQVERDNLSCNLVTEKPSPMISALDISNLQQAEIIGVGEGNEPKRLWRGIWGEDWQNSSTSNVDDGYYKVSLTFAGDLVAYGSVMNNQKVQAAVITDFQTSGSGRFSYLSLFDEHFDAQGYGEANNVATALIGDRVQVIDLYVEPPYIVVKSIQAGEQDPMCCAGDLVTQFWQYQNGKLVQDDSKLQRSRISLDVIAGKAWHLVEKGPLPASKTTLSASTLKFEEGQFVGSTGCNNYSSKVQSSEGKTEIKLATIATTRKACRSDESRQQEKKFLTALAKVERYGFYAGQLHLFLDDTEGADVMVFDLIEDKTVSEDLDRP
ncbi:META domain-containing protein [Photobacterium kagoshimensis]|uniref:META domain-containing protein n=1 Tax=Photobacterium kagoshimensis TaxID=2910242 RepID=UPI003D0D89AF